MEIILFFFCILASANAGHWQEWLVFRKECGSLQRRCIADSYGESKDNPVCVDMVGQPCSGENVLFSNSEEALTKLSKTISLQIGSDIIKVPIMISDDGTTYLIFQRRLDGSVDFYKNWNDYVNGFGNPHGEYWLGLRSLNKLTSGRKFAMTVFLESFDNNRVYARYGTFNVGGPDTNYKLTIDDYSGTAGDAMGYHNGMAFTTRDQDHDKAPYNCAVNFKGAWWYDNCHISNLNGHYFNAPGSHASFADGIDWKPFKGYNVSMKKAIMALSLK